MFLQQKNPIMGQVQNPDLKSIKVGGHINQMLTIKNYHMKNQKKNRQAYQKDLNKLAKSKQNSEMFQGLFPSALLNSEVHRDFCRLLRLQSRLDQEKMIYGMMLHRIQIMEESLGLALKKSSLKSSRPENKTWKSGLEIED